MQTRYRGLRIIGFLLKIIGVFELIVGLVSVLLLPLVFSAPNSLLLQFGFKNLLPGSGLLIGILSGLFVFLCGIVFGLLTFSAGEIFSVLIAIEENTRSALQLLQKHD
jgi:amino acid transporter